MANQKFNHFVSPDLTLDAQFADISDIPQKDLTQGTTIFLHPGTYGALSATFDDIAIVGLGDREEVVIQGITTNKLSANTLTLENLTITPTGNGAQELITQCIDIAGEDGNLGMSVTCRRVTFTNANHAVKIHGNGSGLYWDCDMDGVDRGVLCNGGAQAFNFCHLTPNAYIDSSNDIATAATVLACGGVGGNAGNTSNTIVALIT